MNKVPAAPSVWREDWIIIYVVDLLLMRGAWLRQQQALVEEGEQKLKMRLGDERGCMIRNAHRSTQPLNNFNHVQMAQAESIE